MASWSILWACNVGSKIHSPQGQEEEGQEGEDGIPRPLSISTLLLPAHKRKHSPTSLLSYTRMRTKPSAHGPLGGHFHIQTRAPTRL